MFITLKPYLPFIIPIVVALIVYFFGQRTSKINRFHTQIEQSLTVMVEPLFIKISKIMKEDNDEIRERMIDEIFETYFTNNRISILGNIYLIRSFIKMEKEYNEFKKHGNHDQWRIFWIELQHFYIAIEKEYWLSVCSLYRDYSWYQNNLTTNFLFRSWNELIRMMNESFKFVSLVLCFSVTFAFYEYVLHTFFNQERFLPVGSLQLSGLLFVVVIAIMALLSMMSTLGPPIQRRKLSIIEKIFEKLTKKDSLFMGRSQKYTDNIQPPNYFQRNQY